MALSFLFFPPKYGVLSLGLCTSLFLPFHFCCCVICLCLIEAPNSVPLVGQNSLCSPDWPNFMTILLPLSLARWDHACAVTSSLVFLKYQGLTLVWASFKCLLNVLLSIQVDALWNCNNLYMAHLTLSFFVCLPEL